ncbi:MAG: hypothetical protein KVP17_001963 [Porospora cf. gigantea B]|uniref:uncharacterized protein n=2 Tax=Porospora cf. gigantea B TaxID=2853592 RepID=UPI003571AEFB|nr:MAG: hypothetical protein KVP17_001963 [Porospora cf. gigantea B]
MDIPVEKSHSEPWKLFVGGLPLDVWDDDMRSHFSKFGPVHEVRVVVDHSSGRHRGFGFVTLTDEATYNDILAQDHLVKGRKIHVRRMQNEHVNLARKIFVGGINPVLKESDLDEYFSRFGPIEKTTIMRDGSGVNVDGSPGGRSRGFGFVVYCDEESSKKCLLSRTHMVTPNDKVDIRPAESRSRMRQQQQPAREHSTPRTSSYYSPPQAEFHADEGRREETYAPPQYAYADYRSSFPSGPPVQPVQPGQPYTGASGSMTASVYSPPTQPPQTYASTYSATSPSQVYTPRTQVYNPSQVYSPAQAYNASTQAYTPPTQHYASSSPYEMPANPYPAAQAPVSSAPSTYAGSYESRTCSLSGDIQESARDHSTDRRPGSRSTPY